MPAFTRFTLDRHLALQTRLGEALARTQVSVTEGRLSRPSDAPADWAEVATLSRRSAMAESWAANLGRAIDHSAHAERIFASLTGALTRARELMVQAAGPTGIGAGREPIAAELAAIRADAAALLTESRSDGNPVFAPDTALHIPVAKDLTIISAPALAAVISTSAGSLDQILANAVASVQTGTPALSNSAAALATAFNHVTARAADQGIIARRITDLQEARRADDLRASERRSVLVDTDVAEALTIIQRGLTTLEAARATFVKINERSLFDLLR